MGDVQEKTIRDRQLSYSQVFCRQDVMDLVEWILDATLTLNITVGLFCTNMDILKLLFSKTASCRELYNLLCDNDFFLFALGPSLSGKFRKKGFKLCP